MAMYANDDRFFHHRFSDAENLDFHRVRCCHNKAYEAHG